MDMGMSETWRKTFMLWSKSSDYLSLVTSTRVKLYETIRQNRCYVAFSGGKDSTVLLHLALQIQQDIPVWHWDYGVYIPRQVEAEIQSNMKCLGATNVTVSESVNQGNVAFFCEANRFMQDKSLEVALVGLRKEESYRRKRKIGRGLKGEVYPLADWGWRDVWAYIVSNGLPYPRLYDVYGPVLGYDRARFVTFFDSEFDHLGASYVDGYFFPQFRNSNT